jgi:Holliday junction resolvase RusA-like endonuclease
MSLNWIDLRYKGVIYSKKNSKQIIKVHGKPIIVSNRNAKKNEKDMSSEFALQVIKNKWKPHGRYSVHMYFWRKDNVRRDLDNLTTSVLDALVLAGALTDDNVNNVKELHIYDMGVDTENVGVSVHLDGDEE